MTNKQYLVSMLVSLQGDKLVVSGLRKVERQSKRLGTAGKRLGKGVKTLGQSMGQLALRAALVIPVWLALRSIFTGIITTIRDMITANLDLEEGLARIKTVVSASSKTIESDMSTIRKVILDMAVKTRTPMKDLAETFYFLRTANLDTKQAMEAFEPTVNLAVGTMNNMKDSARALVGIYNTMGDALGDGLTDLEKFEKIADLLTFTYATQDVQLQELTESYTKFAPFVVGLSDNFTEIITTLGFLNTRLLRSGRTGRLTGRAILQLTKNSDKLADIFNITFDPDKPIKFLEIIDQITKRIKTQGKITASQGQAIQEVFATRAGVAVRILINDFDELKEQIKRAGEEAEGFAERMRAIREETTRAQFGRLKNIIAVLANEFVNASFKGETFGKNLKELNDNLEKQRTKFKEAGIEVALFADRIQLIVDGYNNINNALSKISLGSGSAKKIIKFLIPVLALKEATDKIRINFENILGIKPVEDFKLETSTAIDNLAKQREKDLADLEAINKKEQESIANKKEEKAVLKEITQAINHQVNLLKLAGVGEEEIAKFKSKSLDLQLQYLDTYDQILKVQKDENNLIEQELKTRKTIQDQFLTAQITVLKTLGASELDIIDAKRRQLELQREIIGETQFENNLTDLRLQKAVAITKERRKEWDAVTGLFTQFAKADELERGRLRRVIDLIKLDPEKLASQYRNELFDRQLIDEYFSHFSSKGKDEVNKVRNVLFDLGVDFPEGKLELNIDEQRQLEFASKFGEVWETRMLEAVDRFQIKFLEVQQSIQELSTRPSAISPTSTPSNRTASGLIPPKSGRKINVYKIEMGDRVFRIRGEISEEMAERIAKQEYETVKKKLLEDSRFKSNLSKEL